MSALAAVSLGLVLTTTPGCAAGERSGDVRVSPNLVATGGPFDPIALRDLGLTVRWIYDLELASSEGITDLEILDDLVVVVEGPDNFVTAIDVDSGQFAWKRLIGLDLETLYRPMRAGDDSLNGDRIFINSSSRFFTLDPGTGRLVGVQSLEAPVTAGGELIGDFAIFGAAKGLAFAHDIDAGYAKWRYRMTGRLVAPPVRAAENTVFLGDEAGTYVLINVGSGDPAFRNDVFGPIVASAAVHRGDLLVPSVDRSLYALDRNTGNQSWVYRADSPLREAPLSVGRDVYLPTSGGGLIALDSRGNVRWETTLQATPILANHRGLVALGRDTLLLVDPDNGDALQAVRAPGVAAATAAPDGSIILRTTDGRLVRLDPTG
ncbi:MAG: PQQ-binding-like beta-propeller repeat protein [Planctomycetota bacterium]